MEPVFNTISSPMENQNLIAELKSMGQPRLAELIGSGSESGLRLAKQCSTINWRTVRELYLKKDAPIENVAEAASRATSPPGVRLADRGTNKAIAEAKERGGRMLRQGKVGVLIVAGGQGTRLGFDAPKGMYPIGPVSNATLFQILLEKVVAVGRKFGATPPLYMMTSNATHAATVRYLDQNELFGLPAEGIRVFQQGNMPAVDSLTGEALLAGPGEIALSPDGHGGLPAALAASGAFDHMKSLGIERLFYLQVDNPLACVCDCEFLGLHEMHGSEMSTQVAAKQSPQEKVGVVAQIDGKTRIIEYSDLPLEAAERRNDDGSLALWAGNIAVHVINVDFLANAAANAAALPFHIARKAVPHLNESGAFVQPGEPNALKFERFIFDLLPAARASMVMEIEPREAFVPLKNAPGSAKDGPEQVKAALVDQARRWLEAAGAQVETPVEISPLFALTSEDVAKHALKGVRLPAGVYLRDSLPKFS